MTEQMPATASQPPDHRSKGVIWTGVALGTALAILAMMHGVDLKIGGMPPLLGWMVGGLLVWLITVGFAVVVAELLRRHHRQMRRAAARTSVRAARATGRAARHHGGRSLSAAKGWAGSRRAPADGGNTPDGGTAAAPDRQRPGSRFPWPRRRARLRPEGNGPAPDVPGTAGGNGPGPDGAQAPGPGAAGAPGPADGGPNGGGEEKPKVPRGVQPPPWILQVRSLSGRKLEPWSDGSLATVTVHDPDDMRRRLAAAKADPDLQARWGSAKNFPVSEPWLICADCSKHSRELVRVPGDDRDDPHAQYIHRACLDRRTTAENKGDSSMPQSSQPSPGGAIPHAARAVAASSDLAGPWKSLISDTSDFDPADDADLLSWMDGESGGMALYAYSIQDVYETSVQTVGLDPVAMQALHEYADAAASAAGMMQAARQRFSDHYSEVRAFAASGGVLPHDGRFLTGEGD